MNKDEFLEIGAKVLNQAANDFMEKGASPQVMLAVTLTINIIVSKLADTIFQFDEDEIEIER